MYVYSKSPFSRGHHVFAVGIQSAKISRGIRHQWMFVLLTVCVTHKWYLFFNFWLKCWNKTINVIRGSKQLRYQTYFWTETRCTGLAQLSSRVGPVLQSFWEWPNTNTNELSRTSCVKSNLTTHANLWKTTTDWCSGCLLSLLCRWRSYPLFSKLSDITHTNTSRKKKRQYKKVNDLWCSQAVTHPSTNHALLCLTSPVIGRKG